MSARDNILARLRSIGTAQGTVPVKRDFTKVTTAYTLPADREHLVAMFVAQAEKSAAVVYQVHSRQALEQTLGALQADQAVAAEAGIAETGTACLAGSRETTRQVFLCEHLVVVLRAADIMFCQEDYWRQLVSMPTPALHLVTGPSRTADVEQTLQIGAHGPRAVTILLDHSAS